MDVKKLREFAANCLRVAKITADPELAATLKNTAEESLNKAEKIAEQHAQQQQQQQIQPKE